MNFFSNNDSISCPTTEYRLLDEDGVNELTSDIVSLTNDEGVRSIKVLTNSTSDASVDETITFFLEAISSG